MFGGCDSFVLVFPNDVECAGIILWICCASVDGGAACTHGGFCRDASERRLSQREDCGTEKRSGVATHVKRNSQ